MHGPLQRPHWGSASTEPNGTHALPHHRVRFPWLQSAEYLRPKGLCNNRQPSPTFVSVVTGAMGGDNTDAGKPSVINPPQFPLNRTVLALGQRRSTAGATRRRAESSSISFLRSKRFVEPLTFRTGKVLDEAALARQMPYSRAEPPVRRVPGTCSSFPVLLQKDSNTAVVTFLGRFQASR